MEEKTRKKKKLNTKQRYILLGSMVLVLILLIVNTFAWFLMTTRNSLTIDTHVDSWQISMTDEEQTVVQEVLITIDHAYPGMTEYKDVFTLTNTGERDAELSFEVIYARLLEDVYEVSDTGPTHEEIEEMLTDDLPFTFDFQFSGTTLGHTTGNNSQTFTVKLNWAYEAANPADVEEKDEADTAWGEAAYVYNESHKNDPIPTNPGDDNTRYPIVLKLHVIASQTA